VLRHAKAAADGPDGDDHSRPLTPRGARQGAEVERLLAGALAFGAPAPAEVLSSSASRALQTAQAVLPALGDEVELVVERGLYEADPDDIVTRLRLVPDDALAVMVVGHNPTLHDLVRLLLGPDDPGGRARVDGGFPTAALALVGLPAASWRQVAPGTGRLEAFFVPAH
jgi:phosphohistidine phosphatase